MTPLHLAALHGNTEVVDFLLKKEADPNAKDEYGQTPLDRAKNEEIKQLLRAKGGKKEL